MSILIKGMEMPKNCDNCPCYYETEGAWRNECEVLQREHYITDERPDWCPLVPVPPHGRLIDADEISKHKYATIPPYRKEYSDGKPKSEDEVIAFKFGWNDAIDAIVANAPTIIEAESGEI